MAETQSASKSSDPMEAMREMRDAYLGVMSKAMIDAVNTETYAQVTGAMLDGYLTAATPFREGLDKAMLQWLEQMSLPSRQEVVALAERFTNVELRLDDIDAKLDRIVSLVSERRTASKAAPATRPQAAASAVATSRVSRKTATKASAPVARRAKAAKSTSARKPGPRKG
jgi:hypothetical protein